MMRWVVTVISCCGIKLISAPGLNGVNLYDHQCLMWPDWTIMKGENCVDQRLE